MADNAARIAALAALGIGKDPAGAEAPAIALTGRKVYAGGDVERTLTATSVALGYVDDQGLRWYPADGQPGDVVTVTQAQADRLDRLGATLLDDSEDSAPVDQLDALDAAALVELAGTSDEARARVFAYESGRAPSAQRKTVLEASAPGTDGDEGDDNA